MFKLFKRTISTINVNFIEKSTNITHKIKAPSSVYGPGTGTFTGVTQRLLADSNGPSVIGGSGKWCSTRIYSMNRYHKFLLKDGLPSEYNQKYLNTKYNYPYNI